MNMDRIDRLKQTLIKHKDEILNEWKAQIKTSSFSYHSLDEPLANQTFEFVFNYLITDSIYTENQTKKLENFIRSYHVLFPGCISQQFQNRILVEEIFLNTTIKHHPEPLTTEEILWIQNFFQKFAYQFVSIVEEIKDEINTEQIQKLKADNARDIQVLEKISATFVHEFRNPLTVVLGFLQLLKKDNPELPYMEIICSELEQLNDRISQFLAITKKEAVAPVYETLDPSLMCNEIVKFLDRDILDRNIQFTTDFQKGNIITVDPSKFRQILLNILLNAFDALNEQEEKKISFTYELLDNTHIFVLSNNGPKIPDNMRENIFQPFMSTKELGTGIGLYISKKIITALHGEITFTSDEKMTSFYIQIPNYINTI